MNCQHCFIPIEGKICYCPECGFSYHENCWRKNKSKCVQYSCNGKTEVINNKEEKECPFCAEKIKENAIICRFCNREVVKKEEVLIIGKKNIMEKIETLEKKPVLNVKAKKANLFEKLLNPKILFGIILIIGIIYFFSSRKTNINEVIKNNSDNFKEERKEKITKIYSDGSQYIGEFKDDKKDGQGTLTWSNGKKYVGEWKDDKQNGQGTLTWSNGQKYVGEWKDDKQNGQGIGTWSNGAEYIGEWKNDKQNGQGSFTFKESKYVGSVKDGKFDGQGTFTNPDGGQYIGEFKDGKRNGQGTSTYSNGQKHVGEYKDNKENGQGTIIYSNGESETGIWKDGVLVK